MATLDGFAWKARIYAGQASGLAPLLRQEAKAARRRHRPSPLGRGRQSTGDKQPGSFPIGMERRMVIHPFLEPGRRTGSRNSHLDWHMGDLRGEVRTSGRTGREAMEVPGIPRHRTAVRSQGWSLPPSRKILHVWPQYAWFGKLRRPVWMPQVFGRSYSGIRYVCQAEASYSRLYSVHCLQCR